MRNRPLAIWTFIIPLVLMTPSLARAGRGGGGGGGGGHVGGGGGGHVGGAAHVGGSAPVGGAAHFGGSEHVGGGGTIHTGGTTGFHPSTLGPSFSPSFNNGPHGATPFGAGGFAGGFHPSSPAFHPVNPVYNPVYHPFPGSGHPGNFGFVPTYHGGWYHGAWNYHGYGPWNYHPYGWGWGAGFVTGMGMGTMPWSWGYWGYNNPYWNGAGYGGPAYLNYSQPIVMAQSPGGGALPGAPNAAAMAQFDAARAAFYQGDYPSALAEVEAALAVQPNDAIMHQFRGLVQFAMGQYDQAAATDYAVLSIGPGWDWTTLSGMYPNAEIYTQQLRALEAFEQQNPNNAAGHFLLAYHYLTDGFSDRAAQELQQVVLLSPNDSLSKQLLASMTSGAQAGGAMPIAGGPPGAGNPAVPGGVPGLGALPIGAGNPAVPPNVPGVGADPAFAGGVPPGAGAGPLAAGAPAGQPSGRPAGTTPTDAADLEGIWSATRPDGALIGLTLSPNGQFEWTIRGGGMSMPITGTYTLANGYLILNQGGANSLVGQVTILPDRRLNFRLAGDNALDPGLNFTRG